MLSPAIAALSLLLSVIIVSAASSSFLLYGNLNAPRVQPPTSPDGSLCVHILAEAFSGKEPSDPWHHQRGSSPLFKGEQHLCWPPAATLDSSTHHHPSAPSAVPYQALLPLMKSESNERNPEAVATAAEQGLHLCMLAVWDNEFSIGTAMQPKCFRAASGFAAELDFDVVPDLAAPHMLSFNPTKKAAAENDSDDANAHTLPAEQQGRAGSRKESTQPFANGTSFQGVSVTLLVSALACTMGFAAGMGVCWSRKPVQSNSAAAVAAAAKDPGQEQPQEQRATNHRPHGSKQEAREEGDQHTPRSGEALSSGRSSGLARVLSAGGRSIDAVRCNLQGRWAREKDGGRLKKLSDGRESEEEISN